MSPNIQKQEDNVFFSRMDENVDRASRGSCAEEIIPVLKDFVNKAKSAKVDWTDRDADVRWLIERITEVAADLALNTRNYEKMCESDFNVFQKIFEELDALLAETLKSDCQVQNDFDRLYNKIFCIQQIAWHNHGFIHGSKTHHENWRDGMIFQNYENLWRIIHRVNQEWSDLSRRGFSRLVFDGFCDVVYYDRKRSEEKSEEEKMELFMAVLDGKVKIIPVYCHEYREVGAKLVARNNSANEFIIDSDEKDGKSYLMDQLDNCKCK